MSLEADQETVEVRDEEKWGFSVKELELELLQALDTAWPRVESSTESRTASQALSANETGGKCPSHLLHQEQTVKHERGFELALVREEDIAEDKEGWGWSADALLGALDAEFPNERELVLDPGVVQAPDVAFVNQVSEPSTASQASVANEASGECPGHLHQEHMVKHEQGLETGLVRKEDMLEEKEEEWGFGWSAEALLAALDAGYTNESELALGPRELQARDVAFVDKGPSTALQASVADDASGECSQHLHEEHVVKHEQGLEPVLVKKEDMLEEKEEEWEFGWCAEALLGSMDAGYMNERELALGLREVQTPDGALVEEVPSTALQASVADDESIECSHHLQDEHVVKYEQGLEPLLVRKEDMLKEKKEEWGFGCSGEALLGTLDAGSTNERELALGLREVQTPDVALMDEGPSTALQASVADDESGECSHHSHEEHVVKHEQGLEPVLVKKEDMLEEKEEEWEFGWCAEALLGSMDTGYMNEHELALGLREVQTPDGALVEEVPSTALQASVADDESGECSQHLHEEHVVKHEQGLEPVLVKKEDMLEEKEEEWGFDRCAEALLGTMDAGYMNERELALGLREVQTPDGALVDEGPSTALQESVADKASGECSGHLYQEQVVKLEQGLNPVVIREEDKAEQKEKEWGYDRSAKASLPALDVEYTIEYELVLGQGVVHVAFVGRGAKVDPCTSSQASAAEQARGKCPEEGPSCSKICEEQRVLSTCSGRLDIPVDKHPSTKQSTVTPHQLNITGGSKLSCDICGKKYSKEKKLNAHLKTHKTERQHQCHVCKKICKSERDLGIHYRIHSGERPFPCDVCGKRFARARYVTVHKRIHTGERPYPCNVCSESFRDKTALSRHVHRLHESAG